MREKFEANIQDQLTGLEIFAVQKKIGDYVEKFKELVNSDQWKFDQTIAEELGRTLMYFDGENEKQQRLDLTELLQNRIMVNGITFSAKLFDSLVYVYTESQQWAKVNMMLANASVTNCQPQIKTVGFLKKNLVYCFDPTLRASLKENMEKFEKTFFGKAAMELKQQ